MLWIVGILAALVVLICCIRMGVLVTFAGQSAVVELKIALFHIQCYPAKENGQGGAETGGDCGKSCEQGGEKGAAEVRRYSGSCESALATAAASPWPARPGDSG